MSDLGFDPDRPPPGHIDLRLERCEHCGEVAVEAMTLGENLPVDLKWVYRKTECPPAGDHLAVDRLAISNNSRMGN
jgi:hypothetical protein